MDARDVGKSRSRIGLPPTPGNTVGPGRPYATGSRWPSTGFSIGGFGDGVAGYLHFDNRGDGLDVRGDRRRGGLYGRQGYYYPGHNAYRRHFQYPYRHYYYDYQPFYRSGLRYYRPCFGYSYSTVYFTEPYVYRFYNYDTDVYYVESGADASAVYEYDVQQGRPPEVDPVGTAERIEESYHPLIAGDENTLIGRGNVAFASGQYEAARELYIQAVLADERDGYAKFLYAIANFSMGDFDVAGLALRRALLTTVELMEYPVDVRTLYADASRLNAELDGLARHVEQNPGDYNARLLLGYVQYATGEPDLALTSLKKLMELEPTDSLGTMLHDTVLRVSKLPQPDKE